MVGSVEKKKLPVGLYTKNWGFSCETRLWPTLTPERWQLLPGKQLKGFILPATLNVLSCLTYDLSHPLPIFSLPDVRLDKPQQGVISSEPHRDRSQLPACTRPPDTAQSLCYELHGEWEGCFQQASGLGQERSMAKKREQQTWVRARSTNRTDLLAVLL